MEDCSLRRARYLYLSFVKWEEYNPCENLLGEANMEMSFQISTSPEQAGLILEDGNGGKTGTAVLHPLNGARQILNWPRMYLNMERSFIARPPAPLLLVYRRVGQRGAQCVRLRRLDSCAPERSLPALPSSTDRCKPRSNMDAMRSWSGGLFQLV